MSHCCLQTGLSQCDTNNNNNNNNINDVTWQDNSKTCTEEKGIKHRQTSILKSRTWTAHAQFGNKPYYKGMGLLRWWYSLQERELDSPKIPEVDLLCRHYMAIQISAQYLLLNFDNGLGFF